MKNAFTILFIILTVFQINSQSFEEHYKKINEEFDNYLNATEEEYNEYIEKLDIEFSEILKKNWETFEAMRGKIKISEPKPENIPIYIDSLNKEYKIIELLGSHQDTTIYSPYIHKIKPTQSTFFYTKKVTNINYFGTQLEVEHEDVTNIKNKDHFDNVILSKYWDELNNINFSNCISNLIKHKSSLNLNDWGYYLLVREFCKNLRTDHETYKIFTWYLMLKSQYDVKIGYINNRLMVLIPFNTDIYGIPYYIIGHKSYYVFEAENPREIKSYSQLYPLADREIEAAIYYSPNFSGYSKKTFNFSYNGKNVPVEIEVNRNLTDFYNSYPLMEIDNYFNSVMSNTTKNSLFEFLQSVIQNKTEQEAVEFLLFFTQNVFSYKTDKEQFGKEKIFFPDETFLYEYSDCEDRAVFFAYIVKELLRLNVIGLDYSNHVAVAVNFNQNLNGDYVLWQNKKYIICDPTYINAPIGKLLPKHDNELPNVIEIKN